MKKAIRRAYKFSAKCPCGKSVDIYITIPDFGDPPIVNKCNICDVLYWYTPDDDYYIKPLDEQVGDKNCIKCNAKLRSSLESTHKNIKCDCGKTFSLDDNFLRSYRIRYDNLPSMEDIEVYLLYS